MEKTRPWLAILVAAAAVGLVAAVAIADRILYPRLPSLRFSSEEWIGGDVKVRGQMARDLIASRQLMDERSEKVRAILGRPDVERFGGQTIRYRVDLGSWVGGIYLNDLVIRFNKGDEVFQVSIEPMEGA